MVNKIEKLPSIKYEIDLAKGPVKLVRGKLVATFEALPEYEKNPCPQPFMYDHGECCGMCPEMLVARVRDILTDWNFGPMQDRDALSAIHGMIGDNVQGGT